MTTFQRLAKRLKTDLGFTVDIATLKRTYAGKWLRSSGAFSWSCSSLDNPCKVGSIYIATELLRSTKPLVAEMSGPVEIEIIPAD